MVEKFVGFMLTPLCIDGFDLVSYSMIAKLMHYAKKATYKPPQ